MNRDRLKSVLRYMLDEEEFLSPYGIRALSRYHKDHPYVVCGDGPRASSGLRTGESSTGLFGGNSNWRGPIWFPVNYLLIESLQKFHYFLGDQYKVEYPTGSGHQSTLWQVAAEISRRLTHIFLQNADGKRPVFGGDEPISRRSALAQQHSVLRILPRRQWRRHRGESSNRLDGTGGEVDSAERGMKRCNWRQVTHCLKA